MTSKKIDRAISKTRKRIKEFDQLEQNINKAVDRAFNRSNVAIFKSNIDQELMEKLRDHKSLKVALTKSINNRMEEYNKKILTKYNPTYQ